MLTYTKGNEVTNWRPENKAMSQNALWNCKNPHQGHYKKVLCVCSAGLLRAPTTAWVLSQDPYNFNTRAAGTEDYALIPVDDVLLTWADEIVTMDQKKADGIEVALNELGLVKDIIVLNLPDQYGYRDPELVRLIKLTYDEATAALQA